MRGDMNKIVDSLSSYQKDVIKEMVKSDLETGLVENDYEELFAAISEDGDFSGVEEDAVDYYFELAQMGPAGFYEEFSDDFDDWDLGYVAEYGTAKDDMAYESSSSEKQEADWFKESKRRQQEYLSEYLKENPKAYEMYKKAHGDDEQI